MIELREITTGDRDYPFVERLFLGAFPEEERRPEEAQRRNVDAEPRFHCLLASADGRPVGFITYWDFPRFSYVEHFATDPTVRGGGLGAQIFQEALLRFPRPVLLEVEPPEDEMTRRRVGFYRRQGLTLRENIPYVQPPYREGGESVELILMTAPSFLPTPADIALLHREVYANL